MNFSFVQITDHHIRESETTYVRGLATSYMLRAVLRHIATNVADKIDFILSTGDVVDDPMEERYRNFCAIAELKTQSPAPGPQLVNGEGLRDMPIYIIPGNHDDREYFYKCLSVGSTPQRLHNFTFEHKGVRFICFDQGREAKGVIEPETLEFLARELAVAGPAVVVTHHHMIPVGSKMLDDFLADDLPEVWPLVCRPSVLGMLFGHVHNTYDKLIGNLPVLGLRATSFQFTLEDQPNLALQPPHYRLVTIRDGILTSRVYEVPV